LPLSETIRDGGYDVESIFVVASAGAVLSPSVKEKLEEVFPDVMIVNSFGSTETGHQGSAMPGSESGREGRPSFEMDATNTVLDEDLKPLSPGDGRIGRLARSGRVPVGYYKDEEKTRERFVTVDGVRWVLPGDFATIEEDGRITVYGRGANCINTGGEKVFPEEVESALKGHPAVMDCLVVGLPDERWGQRVAAVIEPRPGETIDFASVDAHVRKHVAAYKCPKEVFVCEKVERRARVCPAPARTRRCAPLC
jgi:acyl-coenzyme A synthetase/AMP-(fatty) acid ligase